MYLSEFNYHSPQSLKEALGLLSQNDDAALIAGGTDILVEMNKGFRHHENIISLTGIDELKTIFEDSDKLYIGTGATHNDVVLSPIIRKNFLFISEAASKIGTDQIRNMGTIGGNLCTGASCCDMAPILMVLDASVEILGLDGVRVVSLKDFFIHHRKTSINKAEILTKIIIPFRPSTGASFEKFGLRESASVSVASAAASIRIKNNKCEDASVAIGAASPTPKLCTNVKEILKEKNITEIIESSALLDKVGNSAIKASIPIDDMRGSGEYRKQILKVLVQRAIMNAAERAKDFAHKNTEA